ncbi:uncharacterized protein SAMN06265360_11698 [Haloechinothrix alba]|uniref:Metal-binding protein n=1 Tax=Haloechinothrix alba TaxID=664784 RepID=A0A238YQW4_9PSEU|nr:YceD family protein [Haloechinothrix alba]SNR73372.1 uncharacterized protein SAMN06265360_11698 [Haloechinothrix alba]
MSEPIEHDNPGARAAPTGQSSTAHVDEGAWVIDTREFGRRPGLSRAVQARVSVDYTIGVSGVIEVTGGTPFTLDLLLESVVEGVLATGDVSVRAHGQCARCLDPVTEDIAVNLTELFAYPDSTTEETTEEDEVSHVIDDRIDLEPVVRDAVVLALPLVPLCDDGCQGLCDGCGVKWAELEPGHEHESIDPRWAALVERFEELSDESPREDS